MGSPTFQIAPVPMVLFCMFFWGMAALFVGLDKSSVVFCIIGCMLLVLAVKNTADYLRAKSDDARNGK
jgi:hypothetical protein